MIRTVLSPFGIAFLAACGAPRAVDVPLAKTPELASVKATAHVVVSLPITFQAGGRDLPVPMVAVTVRGQGTQLILDTGASHHVLTSELARSLSLPMKAASDGKDHAGESVTAWEVGAVPMRFRDFDVELADVAAIPGPPPFQPLGIGGFLSPQHLLPTGYAVLDFTTSQLFLVEGTAADVRAWAAARWTGLAPLSLPRANADRKVMVEAAIDPFASVVTELDTGGSGTEFLAGYLADARTGATSNDGVGVSGADIEGFPVPNRVLRVGGQSIKVASILARPTMGSPLFKGLVGMDLFRGTVLAVSARPENAVLWFVKP